MKLDMTGQCTPADLDFIHCVDSCEIERIAISWLTLSSIRILCGTHTIQLNWYFTKWLFSVSHIKHHNVKKKHTYYDITQSEYSKEILYSLNDDNVNKY